MNIEDFRKCFKLAFVCKYVDNYHFCSYQAPIEAEGRYLFKVQVDTAGEYTFALSQKGRRLFPLSSDYQYSDVTMIVAKEGPMNETTQQPEIQFMKCNQSFRDRDNYIEFTESDSLSPGTYWIQVKVEWDEASYLQYNEELVMNINSYGAKKVIFTLD